MSTVAYLVYLKYTSKWYRLFGCYRCTVFQHLCMSKLRKLYLIAILLTFSYCLQVKCPECRAEHRIPYNGVQAFPTNVTLQRFLELHIEITGELPDPTSGKLSAFTANHKTASFMASKWIFIGKDKQSVQWNLVIAYSGFTMQNCKTVIDILSICVFCVCVCVCWNCIILKSQLKATMCTLWNALCAIIL